MNVKLAVAIADDAADPSAFVVWRGLERSIAKAADMGYDGVELALKSASDVDPARLDKWLGRSGVSVSCISTGQVFSAGGLYFTHPDIAVREQTVSVFLDLIRLAASFGGMVNIGRARGFIPAGEEPGPTRDRFLTTLTPVCDAAARLGVTLVMEPVNRYEINFVNTVREGYDLIQPLPAGTMGLMPDVFHMNIEDARIGETLIACRDRIRYVHLADSNRQAPGRGHLDFDEVFGALKEMEYDGWCSVEILPVPDPDTAAAEAVAFLRPRIRRFADGA